MRCLISAVVLALLTAGCGLGDGNSNERDANGLQVTREDGSTIEFPPKLRAWCGELNELGEGSEGGETALHVFGGEFPGDTVDDPKPHWSFSRTRDAIVQLGELELPDETHAQPPVLYIYDAAKNTRFSSNAIDSTGTVRVDDWPGCHKGESVRIVVDANLRGARIDGEVEAVLGDSPLSGD